MKKHLAHVVLWSLFSTTAIAGETTPTLSEQAVTEDLPTVDYVDFERYQGRWYSVSSLPGPFTFFCKGQIADYSVVDETKVAVTNSCVPKNYVAVSEILAEGAVTTVPDQPNSKLILDLKFTKPWWLGFINPPAGNYYVLKLDPDYQIALVGEPSRKFLWILARDQNIAPELLEEYVDYAASLGFDVSKLEAGEF